MSDIQDLKNHVTALTQKLNSFFTVIQNTSGTNEKISEILNLVHNLGVEINNKNNIIFDLIMPDFIRRITSLEHVLQKKLIEKEYKQGDHFMIVFGKGKNKKKVLMLVTENGLKGFIDDNYIDFWKNHGDHWR